MLMFSLSLLYTYLFIFVLSLFFFASVFTSSLHFFYFFLFFIITLITRAPAGTGEALGWHPLKPGVGEGGRDEAAVAPFSMKWAAGNVYTVERRAESVKWAWYTATGERCRGIAGANKVE